MNDSGDEPTVRFVQFQPAHDHAGHACGRVDTPHPHANEKCDPSPHSQYASPFTPPSPAQVTDAVATASPLSVWSQKKTEDGSNSRTFRSFSIKVIQPSQAKSTSRTVPPKFPESPRPTMQAPQPMSPITPANIFASFSNTTPAKPSAAAARQPHRPTTPSGARRPLAHQLWRHLPGTNDPSSGPMELDHEFRTVGSRFDALEKTAKEIEQRLIRVEGLVVIAGRYTPEETFSFKDRKFQSILKSAQSDINYRIDAVLDLFRKSNASVGEDLRALITDHENQKASIQATIGHLFASLAQLRQEIPDPPTSVTRELSNQVSMISTVATTVDEHENRLQNADSKVQKLLTDFQQFKTFLDKQHSTTTSDLTTNIEHFRQLTLSDFHLTSPPRNPSFTFLPPSPIQALPPPNTTQSNGIVEDYFNLSSPLLPGPPSNTILGQPNGEFYDEPYHTTPETTLEMTLGSSGSDIDDDDDDADSDEVDSVGIAAQYADPADLELLPELADDTTSDSELSDSSVEITVW